MFEIQAVKLRGPDGKRWQAYYRMVLIEGDWKIAGVQAAGRVIRAPEDMGVIWLVG